MQTVESMFKKEIESFTKGITKKIKAEYKTKLANQDKLIHEQGMRIAALKASKDSKDNTIQELNKYRIMFEGVQKVYSNHGYKLASSDLDEVSMW